ncbi:hypothetical protein F3Y22_tig00117056pilonHSYRG00463 [Hibiscus syriacus]|uniref:DUF4283 domain-containing protein n=1 Tax=Hibiscus syriacus TaxID=106335 RepID=A0A6A2WD28_HIBSY|nr:hypothetical protein F3Y22_tig00117056pilonHSYRG00463 [Hibiscus syriacus]
MGDIEQVMVGLCFDDDEEEALLLVQTKEGNTISFDNCLVASFLTSGMVNFQAMRSTLANVWHPIGGISTSDLGDDHFLLRLYHTVDLERILADGSWVRVQVDTHNPLKRKKKLLLPEGKHAYDLFQYEKLRGCIRARSNLASSSVGKENVGDMGFDVDMTPEKENDPILKMDGLERPRQCLSMEHGSGGKDNSGLVSGISVGLNDQDGRSQ